MSGFQPFGQTLRHFYTSLIGIRVFELESWNWSLTPICLLSTAGHPDSQEVDRDSLSAISEESYGPCQSLGRPD